jgi:hypothetical protein
MRNAGSGTKADTNAGRRRFRHMSLRPEDWIDRLGVIARDLPSLSHADFADAPQSRSAPATHK